MNFKDQDKSSVQSLLALLRSAQDGDSAPPSAAPVASPTRQTSTPIHGPSTAASGLPTQRQLTDLIHSLNGSRPNAAAPASPTSPGLTGSTSRKSSRNLIEPFGPVGAFPPSSTSNLGYVTSSTETATQPGVDLYRASGVEHQDSNPSSAAESGSGIKEGIQSAKGNGRDAHWDVMPFAKALPVLSGLLGNEGFISELKKADQDALERRLWAKQEKVKAEHERSLQAERDIARIAQRPILPEKKAQWAADLELDLQDFYRQTCLPSFDSISQRHRDRLKELGVPGLGGEPGNEKDLGRWKRIMDLLQAGLEE